MKLGKNLKATLEEKEATGIKNVRIKLEGTVKEEYINEETGNQVGKELRKFA